MSDGPADSGRSGGAPVSRRDALKRLGAAAGAMGLAPGLGAGAGGSRRPGATDAAAERIAGDLGLQLYTVRGEMASDVPATLARVAEIGYREVEFAGYFGHPPSRVRELLAANGLRAPSTHIDLAALTEDIDRELDAARTIGHDWILVAWTPEEMRRTLDDWRRIADVFNGLGEAARGAGLRFGYHNHDFEIRPMEGRMPLEVLMEGTDPALVDLELDLFWITHGGGDPVRFLERWPGRVKLVHVKDRTPDGRMVDVGAGVIDFPGIFARPEARAVRHYFVEHDTPADPWASVTASFRHLRAMQTG